MNNLQLDLLDDAPKDVSVYCPHIGTALRRLIESGIVTVSPSDKTAGAGPVFKITVTNSGRDFLNALRAHRLSHI